MRVPGLEIIRIGEAGSERGPVMVRMRAPFVPIVQGVNDRDHPPLPIRSCWCARPIVSRFSYAGADRVWQPVWRDAQQLPRAIRVTLRDAATQRTLSASTAALVHAELPASCVQAKSLNECFGQPAPRRQGARALMMRTSAQPYAGKVRPAKRPDGFIIVAVLWILGALATLASIYAVYVVNTADGLRSA